MSKPYSRMTPQERYRHRLTIQPGQLELVTPATGPTMAEMDEADRANEPAKVTVHIHPPQEDE